MQRTVVIVLVALVVAAGVYLISGRETAEPQAVDLPDLGPVGATLLDGLGHYSMPVSSDHPEVQRWFDQALMLTYGFNHDAAERSYLRAVELDPECAMCWWGAALVLGPHVNAGMDPANNEAAWERLQAAQAVAGNASDRERAYIAALAARYAEDPPADRTALDEAYATAMGELVQRYPDDVDAATLYAEAMMNLQPWDFWQEDGRPKGRTPEIRSVLESVMARNPDHPGALHLYIHAVEASAEPELGVAAADRLRGLVPGSGHLLHMPSHIYARVGRWHDAMLVNQDAILADDDYLAACRPSPGVYPLGYVPHNHHFLWFAATMAGDSRAAMSAAEETAARAGDPDLLAVPGLAFLQNFVATPVFAKVRFGQWDAIRALPAPDDELPFLRGVWDYAQALAALRGDGDLATAVRHYDSLAALASDPDLEAALWFDRYPMTYALQIAERMVAAELALAEGDREAAISILDAAAAAEDALPYDEPPAWHAPVRQTLGAVLLEAGQPQRAEVVYRAELRRNPENGWSLLGLEQALRAQERMDEAEAVSHRFEQAWAHADIELSGSRF
ncbi:MAG: hypothetical protein JJT88_15105 [Gammaproteobacteria bacterium]|nr:hypothetical protein [Gammaproteobacteria bacterium]